MQSSLLLAHAITSVHFGTGDALSDIDLPTAREPATGLPIGPGSSLKACLRDLCTDPVEAAAVFGPDQQASSDHAGALQLCDLRLACLPVKSLCGIFAWVISPYVIERLNRDRELCGLPTLPLPQVAAVDRCLIADGSVLPLPGSTTVVLLDLDLVSKLEKEALAPLSECLSRIAPGIAARLCVVHDAVINFRCRTELQIDARIALDDDTKTVKRGALWYQESLPAETILVTVGSAAPARAVGRTEARIMATLDGLLARPFQIGGDATTGRGIVRMRRIDNANA